MGLGAGAAARRPETFRWLLPSSSAVERSPVKRLVVGSIPTSASIHSLNGELTMCVLARSHSMSPAIVAAEVLCFWLPAMTIIVLGLMS
jgi:hypothetical protein